MVGSISALLTVLSGPEQGRVIKVRQGSRAIVGRGQNADITLNGDLYISARHVLLDSHGPDRFTVHGLSSTNPPRVNGVQFRTAELRDGGVLEIGYTPLRLAITSDAYVSICFVCGRPCGPSCPDGRDLGLADIANYACDDHVPRIVLSSFGHDRPHSTWARTDTGQNPGQVRVVNEQEVIWQTINAC